MAAGVKSTGDALKGKEADPETTKKRPDQYSENRDRSFPSNRRLTENKVDLEDEEKNTLHMEGGATSGTDRIEVTVGRTSPTGMGGDSSGFLSDTGAERTTRNEKDGKGPRKVRELEETKKRLRPYGAEEQPPIQGGARAKRRQGPEPGYKRRRTATRVRRSPGRPREMRRP